MLLIYAKISAGRAAGRASDRVFTHYRFMLFLIALVVILQIAFGGGLITGLMVACRIISLVIILPLLTMTSPPGDIALCLTRLGFNYKTAYIITSSLNILPSFREDARQLLDARKLRGAMSRGKNVFTRFGEYAKIALPLMIKTMRRASAFGLAMDARAFGAYRARTWRSKTRMSAVDFMALAAGAAYAALVISANYII
jgi:energy-coupling factor transport system permease protein